MRRHTEIIIAAECLLSSGATVQTAILGDGVVDLSVPVHTLMDR
jgi:hypothetical protein